MDLRTIQLQTLPLSTFDVFIDNLTTELDNLVHYDCKTTTNTQITKFHGHRAPIISLRQFVERVTSYATCTVECFVIALVYIQRISIQEKPFVNCMTIHRLFITSVLIAAKYCDDIFFDNKFYATVGGIPCTELNALELEFLVRSKFSLAISNDEFQKFSYVLCGPDQPKRSEPLTYFSVPHKNL